MAEVSTTVERPNSRSRSRPPTHSGATCSTLCRDESGPCSPSHTTSWRLAGSDSANAPSSRVAVSAISSSPAKAILRPAAASGSSRRSDPIELLASAVALASAVSAPAAGSGSASQRETGRSSRIAPIPSPASANRSATAWSTSLPRRRAAIATELAESSAVATPVTRSTSSCASSITTTSCSGSTCRPSIASMASSAWFVTTMSARPASCLARSAKHSSPTGHLETPMHSRALTDTCRHVLSGTPGTSSSRSPVAVSSAQSWIRLTARPIAETWNGSNSSSSGSTSSGPCSLLRHR